MSLSLLVGLQLYVQQETQVHNYKLKTTNQKKNEERFFNFSSPLVVSPPAVLSPSPLSLAGLVVDSLSLHFS